MTMLLGQDIGKELCDALGLPKNTIGFTLRAWVGHCVTVECEYYPEGKEVARALAKFKLIRPELPAVVTPATAPTHYDDWLAQRIELAHRDYMARTSRRLPGDLRIAK